MTNIPHITILTYLRGTNFRGFCCLLKPRKFKPNEIERVHSLLVPVIKTMN